MTPAVDCFAAAFEVGKVLNTRTLGNFLLTLTIMKVKILFGKAAFKSAV